MRTFDGLAREGVVRSLGYSWIEPARLAEARRLIREHGLTPITFFQYEYNIVDHSRFEQTYPDLAIDSEINVLGYHGLKSGFLSGKYIDPAMRTDHTPKIAALLADPRAAGLQQALHDVSRKHGASPAAVAIAWFKTRAIKVAPLVSARDEQQLAELLQAQKIRLDSEDVSHLRWE